MDHDYDINADLRAIEARRLDRAQQQPRWRRFMQWLIGKASGAR